MIPLFLSSLIARIWPYVLMAGAVLAVLLGAYSKGRTAGRAAIEAKQAVATVRAQKRIINDVQAANDARNDVRALPPDRVRDRDAFSRD